MASETFDAQRKAFAAREQIAALNDLIARIRYSYRHDPERVPAALPDALPSDAGEGLLARCYASFDKVAFSEIVRGLCEPMQGAFPGEAIVRVLTRCLPNGTELERRYRVNTGVPAEN